jgi:hypothetical protein
MGIPCIFFHLFIFIDVAYELNVRVVGFMLDMISLDVALLPGDFEESGCMKDVVMQGLREVDVLFQFFERVYVVVMVCVGVDCVFLITL